VKRSLEHFGGIRVHVLGDPQLALAKVRELAPDLVVLDYLMPGLDGVTLFKQLQADPDLARIPVVFLTASAEKDKAESMRALGAAGVLIKPFNVRELPQKLFEIWNALKNK
jgi:CheY-like chemotaxis protein